MEKINVLSPELAKIVNDARPKKGQVIYFESLRPQGGGSTVKPVDRIYDPWAVNEDGSKGAYTDIGNVIGQLPAMGTQPARHNFGRLQFTKTTGNTIDISGQNRGDDTKFLFLFLTNQNMMNKNKPWYAPSDGYSIIFTQQTPAMAAEDRNIFRRKVRAAGEKIDITPNEKLLDLALALDMKNINQFSKMEEIRDKLYEIAEKNPERVMGMDKDINLNMKLRIKEALKLGIWQEDRALKLFVWADTQEPVFATTPGQDLYNSAIKYFQGAGEETYNLLAGLIEKAKKKAESKKSFVPESKNPSVGKVIDDASNAGDGKSEKKFVVSKEVVEVKD